MKTIPRAEIDQETALTLLRSEQMTTADYLALCKERGWDEKWGLSQPDKDDRVVTD